MPVTPGDPVTAPPQSRRQRPERELRGAIIALLRAYGIAAWATGVGAHTASYNGKTRFVRTGTKGMSDIIGIIRTTDGVHTYGPMIGRFLAIEVKNPGGDVSQEQAAFLQTVNSACGIGFVARSCEDVIDKLGLKR